MSINEKIKLFYRPVKPGRSAIKDTRIILFLLFVLFLLLIISFTFSSPEKLSKISEFINKDNPSDSVPYEYGLVNPTFTDVSWEVNFPNNYSIKDNDSFETKEFAIYYEKGTDKYYINIYEGENYTFEQIKYFLQEEVISKADDFQNLNRKFPESLITYYDYRGQDKPED